MNPSNTILPFGLFPQAKSGGESISFLKSGSLASLPYLTSLDLGANLMTEVPYDQLEDVADTLEVLDLSDNVFVEMGSSWFVAGGKDTFPVMPMLK